MTDHFQYYLSVKVTYSFCSNVTVSHLLTMQIRIEFLSEKFSNHVHMFLYWMLNYCYIWNRKSSSTFIEKTYEDDRKIFPKKNRLESAHSTVLSSLDRKKTLLTVADSSLLVIAVARSRRMMATVK